MLSEEAQIGLVLANVPPGLGPEEGAAGGLGGSWKGEGGAVQSVSHPQFRGSAQCRAPLIPESPQKS